MGAVQRVAHWGQHASVLSRSASGLGSQRTLDDEHEVVFGALRNSASPVADEVLLNSSGAERTRKLIIDALFDLRHQVFLVLHLFELEFLDFEVVVLADFAVVLLEVDVVQDVLVASFLESLLDFAQLQLPLDVIGGRLLVLEGRLIRRLLLVLFPLLLLFLAVFE